MLFTIEIHKTDKRTKSGLRFVGKYEYDRKDRAAIEREIRELFPMYGEEYKFTIIETMVERVNHLTGTKFMERYDTPFHCSASSESYWCN
jgi:hypothetical protein